MVASPREVRLTPEFYTMRLRMAMSNKKGGRSPQLSVHQITDEIGKVVSERVGTPFGFGR